MIYIRKTNLDRYKVSRIIGWNLLSWQKLIVDYDDGDDDNDGTLKYIRTLDPDNILGLYLEKVMNSS